MESILLTLIIIGITWFLIKTSDKIVTKIGDEKKINDKRVLSVKRVIKIILILGSLVGFTFVLGIDYSHIFIFLSSALAILGVAFFAQWSILSNVTSSIIVYFFFPYQVGDTVKIVDGDNSIEGVIREISLFHVILDDDKGHTITYPNSMVFQKAVIITTTTATVAIISPEENITSKGIKSEP